MTRTFATFLCSAALALAVSPALAGPNAALPGQNPQLQGDGAITNTLAPGKPRAVQAPGGSEIANPLPPTGGGGGTAVTAPEVQILGNSVKPRLESPRDVREGTVNPAN